MRYLGEHHEHGSAPTWKFLAAVSIGQVASFGAAALTRRAWKNDACSTQSAAEYFVTSGTFLIVSGLTWIFLTRKP